MTVRSHRCFYAANVLEVPPGLWRWPDFSFDELKCKGGGGLLIDVAALDRLQALRRLLGFPVNVNSAYRSLFHNLAVGGADDSLHMQGRAFDIWSEAISIDNLAVLAVQVGFTGLGIYPSFLHVDDGPRREWRG